MLLVLVAAFYHSKNAFIRVTNYINSQSVVFLVYIKETIVNSAPNLSVFTSNNLHMELG